MKKLFILAALLTMLAGCFPDPVDQVTGWYDRQAERERLYEDIAERYGVDWNRPTDCLIAADQAFDEPTINRARLVCGL
jgi:hypothetical protein